MCSEKTQVKLFGNNKPWIKPSLRKMIIATHRAYGTAEYQEKHKELCKTLRAAKSDYKTSIENLFKTNNSKEAWRGLRIITGMADTKKENSYLSSSGIADRLNNFYSRFDDKDFTVIHQQMKEQLTHSLQNFTFRLDKQLVKKVLNKVSIRKASGPDNISGRLLKICKGTLNHIIWKIFELSFVTGKFPDLWKWGEIVPVQKKARPQQDNDFRPVTLTAVLAKCLERVGLALLQPYIDSVLDPLQFAYRKGRSTTDAVVTVLHKTIKHLDKTTSSSVHLLCIDYSSAFNTIQPHLMIEKLLKLNIPEFLQLWVLDFLTLRPQYVRTCCEVSGVKILNTGAPQGCVLSPVLFSLYTNDLCWQSRNVQIVKYADDTIIVGLIDNSMFDEYLQCVNFVSKWCNDNFLVLNVSKTKEMKIDFRKNVSNVDHDMNVSINDEIVARCQHYKYLGITIDKDLKFHEHVNVQCRKAFKKVYYVRVLSKLNVKHDIVTMFFNATVIPTVTYGCSAFYNMLTQDYRNKLCKPCKICGRMLKKNPKIVNVSDVYENSLIKTATNIIRDISHPLHSEFCLLPSGRRWRVPSVRTSRFQRTFVPSAINFLNVKHITHVM